MLPIAPLLPLTDSSVIYFYCATQNIATEKCYSILCCLTLDQGFHNTWHSGCKRRLGLNMSLTEILLLGHRIIMLLEFCLDATYFLFSLRRDF